MVVVALEQDEVPPAHRLEFADGAAERDGAVAPAAGAIAAGMVL